MIIQSNQHKMKICHMRNVHENKSSKHASNIIMDIKLSYQYPLTDLGRKSQEISRPRLALKKL